MNAFHIIYTLPFHPEIDTGGLATQKALYYDFLTKDHGIDEFRDMPMPSRRDMIFTDKLVWGVFDRLEWLDMVAAHFLTGWDIARIARADLAILRIAIYEILCDNTVPPAAAINEAIEISKAYSPPESPAFVNGVLARIADEIEKWRQ